MTVTEFSVIAVLDDPVRRRLYDYVCARVVQHRDDVDLGHG